MIRQALKDFASAIALAAFLFIATNYLDAIAAALHALR